jgi:5'-methylthioadenosine phosphorylase
MRVDAGIIGGTGIGERLLALPGEALSVDTSAGTLSGKLVQIGGKHVLAIGRHSEGHKVPPHLVNYRAMALGLKQLGAQACFSTAAVGSLRREWTPGTLVACSDFLDLTGRFQTLFDETVVHTDFSVPFPARTFLLRAADEAGERVEDGGVYICCNGPRYETPFEISLYQSWGGDLVGMTAATEAILMREAGVPYGCLAIVTNLAAGLLEQPLSHEEVVVEMTRSGERAMKILSRAVSLL